MEWRRIGIAPVFSLAALVSVHAANAQPPTYMITDTGPARPMGCAPEGGPFLNQSGQAIEWREGTTIGSVRTYFIDTNGTQTDIGTLFGFDTFGQAINSHAAVTGWSASILDDISFHAFIWTSSQGIRDIGLGSSSVTCGLNNAGDVVGVSSDPRTTAFVYTGGQTYDLNTLGIPGTSSWDFQSAQSINDVGQIFGVGFFNNVSHGFILTPTAKNLLVEGGFEGYTSPALGSPGWVSDSLRQIAAKSETNQPHSGAQNGACWATTNQDCGMYQDVQAPRDRQLHLDVLCQRGSDGRFGGCEHHECHCGAGGVVASHGEGIRELRLAVSDVLLGGRWRHDSRLDVFASEPRLRGD
jgi:probable HAF family extracellular repeat protein